MKLSEAKQILKANGYIIKESAARYGSDWLPVFQQLDMYLSSLESAMMNYKLHKRDNYNIKNAQKILAIYDEASKTVERFGKMLSDNELNVYNEFTNGGFIDACEGNDVRLIKRFR